MFRQILVNLTLITNAAAALLGHAGLHDLIGHRHSEHVGLESAPSVATHGCSHGHHQDHIVDGEHRHDHSDGVPESPERHDHDSEDCLVCQYTAQAQSHVTLVELPSLSHLVDSTCCEERRFVPAGLESLYESRGPPLAIAC
jgi:hypothetical protein